MTDPLADDDELVFRLGYGDTTAARDLYERHGAALLRFGMAMTASRHTAEDLVHDTFVEVLQDPRRFDPARGSVAAYLFGIARHRLSRLVRSGLHAIDGPPTEDIVCPAAPAEEAVDRTHLIDRVRRAILDLPFSQREVLALCDLEELPYTTVAAILDCPIGTVRSRLHRARALLATRLVSLGLVMDGPTRTAGPGARLPDESDAATLAMELPCKGTLKTAIRSNPT